MTRERRQHQRVARPFEGIWQGASGSGDCRIADLSLGGCFIQTLAMPVAGETTVVTVKIGNNALSLPGTILYVEPNMGFAVKFHEMPPEQFDEFERLLEALQQRL